MKHYKLEGRNVVPIEVNNTNDLLEWARLFESTNRRVAYSVLSNGKIVSTVFMGIDHNMTEGGDPLVFETMVFNGIDPETGRFLDSCDDKRVSTYDEAEQTHKEMVQKHGEVI